jgi:hypothetical protein
LRQQVDSESDGDIEYAAALEEVEEYGNIGTVDMVSQYLHWLY